MAITVQGPTGVFQPSYPDIIDKYGVVTKMFTSSFKEYFTSSGAASYSVNKSLRFRSSASAYLNRTAATATNQKTFTWSAWVKLGNVGTGTRAFFNANPNSSTDGFNIYIGLNSDNDIGVSQLVSASNVIRCATNAVYRDPAAWYHVVVVVDTTQATNSNGVVIYVNGAIQTLTFNAYTQNANTYVNSAISHQLGRSTSASGGSGAYYDGEMAEVNFVDGIAVPIAELGASSTYNQWLPIKYAGTYGTNGFYLPFTNTASTSTLVADSSGNANNWTPNNISLTAGITYDSLTDVPTLTSTTVANYAVLNPLSIRSGAPKSSDGNLTIAWGGTYPANALATIGVSTGKWYWEVGFAGGTFANNPTVGVAVSAWSNVNTDPTGAATPFSHLVGGAGSFYNNGTATVNAVTFGPGDTVGVALNCDTNVVSFYKNNTLIGTAQSIDSGQTWFPFHANSSFTALTQYANYGQQPFVYPTPPSGFLPLNTFNI